MRDAIRSGWKTSKSSSFSPVDANMTGLRVSWAIDSAAPPRASPSSLVEHDAVVANTVQERLGRLHGVLPDHRVDHEQDLVRVHRIPDVGGLVHHLLIDASRQAVSMMTMLYSLRCASAMAMLAACTGSPTPLPGNGANTGTRPALRAPAAAAPRWDAAGQPDQQGRVALGLQPQGQFASQGGLTRALQASRHDDGWRDFANRKRRASPPRISTSSSLTILITCWAGFSASDLGPARALPYFGDELTDDGQRDIGLEQSDPDLAAGRIDIGLGEPAAAAQRREDLGKPVGESLEHVGPPSLLRADVRLLRRRRLYGLPGYLQPDASGSAVRRAAA